jgi:LysM repeat protein
MKKNSLLLIILVIALALSNSNRAIASTVSPAPALIPSPGEVISAINLYRQQNGLAPLSSNSLLGSLAQGQSDYQASIGSITHTGPGGTTPQQRATNVGYGGGAFFYLSEIIYGGQGATTGDAMSWWKNSGLHNSIMLDSKYTEIGAGVSTDGTRVYFTAELGGPTGGSSGSSSQGSNEGGSFTEGQGSQVTQAAYVSPFIKSTPEVDGSIIHEVSQGQTLWTIAAIYEIDLDELLTLNSLTRNSFVFPGDKIIIRTPAIDPTPTATLVPVETAAPNETPPGSKEKVLGTPFSLIIVPQDELGDQSQLDGVDPATTDTGSNIDGTRMVPTLVIAAVIILILSIVISNFYQNKPARNDSESFVD